jgi:hypothetical protein
MCMSLPTSPFRGLSLYLKAFPNPRDLPPEASVPAFDPTDSQSREPGSVAGRQTSAPLPFDLFRRWSACHHSLLAPVRSVRTSISAARAFVYRH